jgi:hypothetical protein
LYGAIVSEWKKEGNVFTLYVTIPANTKATVYIPGAAGKQVTENGKAVQVKSYVKGAAVVEVGAGKYEFVVK